MKAIITPKYGPPELLELREVETPIPKDNQVLIKIHAATVTAGDCELRSMSFPLWLRPLIRMGFGIWRPRKKIMGQELSGQIEDIGKDVTRFNKGDQVFGNGGFSLGSYAEFKCQSEKSVLAIKPTIMTYDEAATISTGGLNALHFLRFADLQPGQKILINGAGGSIGTYAIQLAKLAKAEVIAVDSTEKLDMLLSIGADRVIDYTKEDFTKSGETYDVIFDIIGKSSYSDSLKSLKENGFYLLGNPRFLQLFRSKWTSWRTNKNVITEFAKETPEDLNFLTDLIEAGKLKSVIDRRYPLEQVAEAHTYVETGKKLGNVVITVFSNDNKE
ncbi:MAG: NAD(P)-dependent alcohol dehydrogenase [Candidatus Heimdallarchaeota archaeon]|nr:NAD(P)-dependent alcohol dehydrogenase [Candidatus Heimdallarchaeota archaeon]